MSKWTRAARERQWRALVDSVTDAAEDLRRRAIDDAPIETGDLRASAVVEVDADRARGRVEATVSFNVPHAAAQHEGHAEMHRHGTAYTWQAREWPGGGGPKYLERNLKALVPRYTAHIEGRAP